MQSICSHLQSLAKLPQSFHRIIIEPDTVLAESVYAHPGKDKSGPTGCILDFLVASPDRHLVSQLFLRPPKVLTCFHKHGLPVFGDRNFGCSSSAKLDLLFEQLCPSCLHDHLDGPAYTACLCDFATEYVHLAERVVSAVVRCVQHIHRRYIGRTMVYDCRSCHWSNLKLLKYCFRVEVDGAMKLFPNADDQLVKCGRLENKLFRCHLLSLWKVSCIDLHLSLMLAVVLLDVLVLRYSQTACTLPTRVGSIAGLFSSI